MRTAGYTREGRTGIYKHCGFWQCMDTRRDKYALERLWRSGSTPWRRW